MKIVPGHPRLHERDGTYYYRARVPNELVAELGRREIKKSLRTKNKKVAIQRLRIEDAEVERLFRQARSHSMPNNDISGLASSASPLDRIKIQSLADDYFSQLEERAQREWFERADLAGGGNEELVDTLQDDLAEVGRRLREQDLRDFQKIASNKLRAQGFEADRQSPLFRELCALLAQAQFDHLSEALTRALGNTAWPANGSGQIHSRQQTNADGRAASCHVDTVDDLIATFVAEPDRRNLSPKTHIAYEIIFRLLREILGGGTPLSEITRAHCRRVRDTLLRWPPNATKRFRGMSVGEIVKVAQADGLPTISPKTVNNYLNNLSALFEYAVQEGIMPNNPARGLILKEGRHTRKDREPFTNAELKKIFLSPSHRIPFDVSDPEPGKFWVPLLALWMGLRMNEACQLETSDVRTEDNVLYIDIAPGIAADGSEKRVKTSASERRVPLHPTLLQMGFEQFIEDAQRGGRARLFPDLIPSRSTGYYSDRFSKSFSRYLARAGIKSPRKSFHSFRHNFLDPCREANMPIGIQAAIGGWTEQGSSRSQANYGSGYSVPRLYEEIAKVRYPDLLLRGE